MNVFVRLCGLVFLYVYSLFVWLWLCVLLRVLHFPPCTPPSLPRGRTFPHMCVRHDSAYSSLISNFRGEPNPSEETAKDRERNEERMNLVFRVSILACVCVFLLVLLFSCLVVSLLYCFFFLLFSMVVVGLLYVFS